MRPNPHWPLFSLRVTTPRLELRVPDDEDIVDLIEVVDRQGIHDPDVMPFSVPWTDRPAPYRQRESCQWYWRCRAEWRPEDWKLSLAVVVDGHIVGAQDLAATWFPVLGVVSTGSWLGREHQGRGIGKEMRAAVLHLAFEGLGASEAHSGAFSDNAASLATSRALGYEDNGMSWEVRREQRAPLQHLRMTKERWLEHRREDIAVSGLEPCLDLFGIARS